MFIIKNLKTYAYMCHFYKSAGPFYDDILVQVKNRDFENLPLEDIYQFRFFDSKMGLDEIYNIVKKTNDLELLKQIKGIINLSKWHYIGDDISEEEKERLRVYMELFGAEQKVMNAKRIIDPKIHGMHPIIIDNLDNVTKIHETNCREKSLVKINDFSHTKKKWL
ncbi:MAG: hypothetical protein PHW32_02110 [Bacilli bacterium]|nr:hypothetical protein [Bacilli bacterium]MDD4282303.1 hypothetical protein [Bacilli bacterium]MDD4718764.1 hypothetical protein [Bacilli bacterium]